MIKKVDQITVVDIFPLKVIRYTGYLSIKENIPRE